MCPECAHLIYGYDNCDHEFDGGRCKLCGWNGRRSRHTQNRFRENQHWRKIQPLVDLLVTAADGQDISSLEAAVGMTRRDVVTFIIERTHWGADKFPELQGNRGTVSERHRALLANWDGWKNLKD